MRQIFFNLDPTAVGFRLNEVQARRDDFIQIFIGQSRFHVPSVVENLLDQPFNPIDVIEHNSTEFTDKSSVILTFRSQLNKGLDRRQRISDFMSEPSGDGFQRTQSISSSHEGLGLPEILIQQEGVERVGGILGHRSQEFDSMGRDDSCFYLRSEQYEGDQLSSIEQRNDQIDGKSGELDTH